METNGIENDYDSLVTRTHEYQRTLESPLSSPPSRKKGFLPKRNHVYLKCKAHTNPNVAKSKDSWKEENTTCSSCIKYESRDYLRSGILPIGKEVMEYLLTLRSKLNGLPGDKQRLVALDVKLHWIFCNVYPLSLVTIRERVDTMFKEYQYLNKVINDKKKEGSTYWNRFEEFLRSF